MVTLYCADIKPLASREVFYKYYDMLDEERKSRVDAVKTPRHKCQIAAAGALLLRAFGEGARYKKNALGKPYLVGGGAYFNVSHSGDIVALAVSNDEVGCDVQYKGAFGKLTGRLSAVEKGMLARTLREDDENSEKAFYDLFRRIWAAKESYVKALGVGLRRPLRSYTVRIQDETPRVDDSETGKRYYLKEYNLKDYFDFADGYACFCCSPYNNFSGKVIVEELS